MEHRLSIGYVGICVPGIARDHELSDNPPETRRCGFFWFKIGAKVFNHIRMK